MKVRANIKVEEERGQCNDREVGSVQDFDDPSSMFFALKTKGYFQQVLWPQGGKWN